MPSIKNRYGFRLFSGTKLVREHMLTINPQDLDHTEPVKVTVVETFGGAYADDYGRAASQQMTISGHTGYRGREGFISGADEFKQLREKIFRQRDIAGAIMVFDNYVDNEHYIVSMTQFSMKKSATRPLHYNYVIQMTTLGKYENKLFPFVDNVSKYFQNIRQTITDIASGIRNTALNIESAITETEQALAGPIYAALDTSLALADTMIALKNLSEFPFALASDVVTIWDTIGKEWDNINRFSKPNYTIINGAKKMKFYITDAEETAKAYADNYITPDNITKQTHTMSADEDIQTIAANRLGDFSRWQEILALNNLTVDDLVPGITLLLPIEDADNLSTMEPEPMTLVSFNQRPKNPAVKTMTESQMQEFMLGSDLNRVIQADGNGNLAVISGMDNMVQILEDKLEVYTGEMLAHPEFGTILPEIIGSPMIQEQSNKLSLEIQRMLLMDERVKSVDNVKASTDGQIIEWSADATIKGNIVQLTSP